VIGVRARRVTKPFGRLTRSPILRILARSFMVAVSVMLVAFSLMRIAPGDPVVVLLGDQATEENIAAMRTALGLDGSYPEQLANYLQGLAGGDMGKSIAFGVPVTRLIAQAMPVTLQLMLVSILLTVFVAVPLAVYVALHPTGRVASLFLIGSSFFVAMPAFFVGLMALLVAAVWLKVAPVAGMVGNLPGAIQYLWLPSLVICVALVPILARVLAASISNTLREEYVEVAIVRGVRGRTFAWRYLIRPSIAPTLSLLSYIIGSLFASAVVIELVFNLQGTGSLLVGAVASRDYPVVQGIVLFSGIFVVLVGTVADIITVKIDPRVGQ
jgi:peptide/nickel transport system permease protein